MCPTALRVCSEPGSQKPVLSLSLDCIGLLGINYKEIWNKMQWFSVKKMWRKHIFKMSSRPQCVYTTPVQVMTWTNVDQYPWCTFSHNEVKVFQPYLRPVRDPPLVHSCTTSVWTVASRWPPPWQETCIPWAGGPGRQGSYTTWSAAGSCLSARSTRDGLVGCAAAAGRSVWSRYNTINSLRPSDAIWQHRSGSTLAQVMACCLMAPSHYLNQSWLLISQV